MKKKYRRSFVVGGLFALLMSLGISSPSRAVTSSEESINAEISSSGRVELSVAGQPIASQLEAVHEQSKVLSTSVGLVFEEQVQSSSTSVSAAVVSQTNAVGAWNFADGSKVTVIVDGEQLGNSFPADGSVELPTSSKDFEVLTVISDLDLGEGMVSETLTSTLIPTPKTVATTPTMQLLSATSLLTLPDRTTLRYLTFIADSYLDAPVAGCLAPFSPIPGVVKIGFDGNNRNFGPMNNDNKTKLQVNIDWNLGSTSVYKLVSPTIMDLWIEGATTPIFWPLTADDSNIYAIVSDQSNSSLNLHLHHEAVNPFCLAQPIYYDVRGQVYRNGNYTLHGEFRQVPNHEFYIKNNLETSWNIIYRSRINPTWRFYCLTPLMFSCITTDRWTQDTPSVWY